MHFANITKSERLKKVLDILADRKEHSTIELAKATDSVAIHSDISEIRANGFPIERRYAGKNDNGRQINYYRWVTQ